MRLIWYYFVKYYIHVGFLFYYKKLRFKGLENIPKNKAILFVSNHQNALIDALLIGAFTPREMHYLTRSNVFNNSIIRSLLASVNMLPIYRIRDGFETLSKNEAVFKKCHKILNNKGAILIFPEGNHNLQRRVRILSKGFIRIVFGAIEKNTELEIDIIPIGINYSCATQYSSKVSIYYGEPISVKHYLDNYDKIESTIALKKEVSDQLKKLTTHIEDNTKHDHIVQCFMNDEFLFPEKVNKKLGKIISIKPRDNKIEKKINYLNSAVRINSLFPLMIWKNIYPKIHEKEFISTFRFTVGITAFPIFYFLQTWLITFLFGITIGILYLSFSFLSVYILTKTKE